MRAERTAHEERSFPRLDVPYPLALALVAIAYFAIAKVGLSFAADHDVVSAVWPPSGIALAAVVLLGYRVWPAIALAAFLANATGESSLGVAAGIAAGNALAAIVAGLLLSLVRFEPALRRVRDVVALAILGAGISTAVNATIGVSTLWAGGIADWEGFSSFWRVWWLGDLTGVLLVAPAILVAASGPERLSGRVRIAEASMLAAGLAAATLVVLSGGVTLAYPVFPLIVLVAMRFRQPGAVFSAVVVSTLGIAFTAAGEGPFVGGSPDDELLRSQLFVALAAMTGLLVAAMRSEWERAERAVVKLAESEQALAEAQELAHVGSWEWDLKLDRVSWSDQLYRLFGVSPSEFVPSYASYLGLADAADRRLIEEAVEAALGGAEPFSFEHRVVRRDGKLRRVQCNGRVICDEGGRPTKMMGTVQDVTEQQLAQQRFRDLLESAPDAMVIVDEAGTIELVNSQTERMFGYARAELVGRHVEILVPEHVRDAHRSQRELYSEAPEQRPMGAGAELTALRKDGSEFPVEISLSPLRTGDRLLVSSAIRDVTERQRASQELHHQALHDPLTGLPNRVLFLDRLQHALARSRRPGSRLAVFFCDIDNFKRINDSRGHEAGDELLVTLPPRLRGALRPADTIARFGGDEFVILCEDLGSAADAIRVAERLTESFQQPFALRGHDHHLSISVGVVFVEAGMATASAVLRDADVALYRAKALGRGRVELFDERMRARVVERLAIEDDLRDAVEADELRLVYQPILALERDEFVAAEALVRWQHPERGLLGPAQFIEIAEDSGQIIQLGAWVVEHVLADAAAWQRRHPHLAELGVSINLSPRQVADASIVTVLGEAIEASGIDPARVDLEITERALIEDGRAALATLDALKQTGVRLVLDDFGTGHSSLSRLKLFPFDALKIDRAFVDGLGTEAEDTAIVTAVLSMAWALDVDAIAEGVETRAQLEWLREHGCRFAQGFFMSHPVGVEELARLDGAATAGADRSRLARSPS